MDRRTFLWTSGLGAFVAAGPSFAEVPGQPAGLGEGARASAVLEALPGKRALIKRSYRPPNFETPLEVFRDTITPNDAFFVRYHLAGIPDPDPAQWRLSLGGAAAGKSLSLSLADLQSGFEQVELPAVCLCSGNRRGLSSPHVAGVQWGYGAMGNARWGGVRLRDLLAKVAPAAEAMEVLFDGADSPVLERTPDYVKSLPLWKALDENTLLAFTMNGEPLPRWNGAPVRLVVPGWTATYWVKHLDSIRVETQPLKNFWMASAYRIPKGKFPVVDRFLTQETETTTPITEIIVNSLLTSPLEGQRLAPGDPLLVEGIAWDGGFGIASVDVSTDGGVHWSRAELAPELGRFSFRGFRQVFPGLSAGRHVVMARASNRAGTTQTLDLIFNPAGYHNNVVQRIAVDIV